MPIALSTATEIVDRYLVAEEQADFESISDLFSENPRIKNAANPELTGPDALMVFCRGFWDRTEQRAFEVIDISVQANTIYAFVNSALTFRAGATFGPVIARGTFEVTLPTALKFVVNENYKIIDLLVCHETATAARLAVGPR
ncbi:nuclear transport factor 2 family protein [Streptomyces sp. NPDC002688]|uniref:nuclear transport factor 2 family protein n=1 Tax=Streptomyces sp. NPDC002688 TaxID=3154423 RepID=UPI0033192D4E